MASGGKKRSTSQSTSISAGSSAAFDRTFVDPAQTDFLQSVRGQAADVAGNTIGTVGELAGGIAEQGQSLIDRLSAENLNPATARLLDFRSSISPERLQPGNIEPVIAALGEDINRQLQRQLTGAGGIGSEFALAGSLGGGRNQVEAGIAGEGAISAFAREAGQIRAADEARVSGANQAADLQAQLANAGFDIQALTQAGVLSGQTSALNQQGQLAAANLLPQLFNLGLAPANFDQATLQFLSGIIGTPTVLSEGVDVSQQFAQSQSTGRSRASDISFFGG